MIGILRLPTEILNPRTGECIGKYICLTLHIVEIPLGAYLRQGEKLMKQGLGLYYMSSFAQPVFLVQAKLVFIGTRYKQLGYMPSEASPL